jgi:hypothetical protein
MIQRKPARSLIMHACKPSSWFMVPGSTYQDARWTTKNVLAPCQPCTGAKAGPTLLGKKTRGLLSWAKQCSKLLRGGVTSC